MVVQRKRLQASKLPVREPPFPTGMVVVLAAAACDRPGLGARVEGTLETVATTTLQSSHHIMIRSISRNSRDHRLDGCVWQQSRVSVPVGRARKLGQVLPGPEWILVKMESQEKLYIPRCNDEQPLATLRHTILRTV